MFRGEGGNGLTLREFWSFYLSPLFQLFLSGGMGLVSLFFHCFCSSFFLKEDDPYSMRIELLEGSIAWIDHSRWIGSLLKYWVLL